MPYIENEWQAVKDKFANLYVMDSTSKRRNVMVKFGDPESELSQVVYPMVVIDPKAPIIDHEREQRGWVNIPYAPEGVTAVPLSTFDPTVDVNKSPYWMDYPMPVNFDFTVSVLTRTQRHMLQLMHRFQQMDMLPQRNGYIVEPLTNTIRSLFVIGGPAYDSSRDGDNKRVFRMTYVIRVPGEMLASEFDQSFGTGSTIGSPVQSVNTTFDGEMLPSVLGVPSDYGNAVTDFDAIANTGIVPLDGIIDNGDGTFTYGGP